MESKSFQELVHNLQQFKAETRHNFGQTMVEETKSLLRSAILQGIEDGSDPMELGFFPLWSTRQEGPKDLPESSACSAKRR